MALAATVAVWRWLTAWADLPALRGWALPLTLGVLGAWLLHGLDAPLDQWAHSRGLSGDVRRELAAWQQFGALGSMIFAGAVIWLLDERRRIRLWDLLLSAGLVGLASTGAKMLVGRPRPLFNDPDRFLGPLGVYPLDGVNADGQPTKVLVHAWDLSARHIEQLWSMPSSHTAFAMLLAVFLGVLYPRLWALCVLMVVVVMTGRLLFDAHWFTDLLMGAAVGYAACVPAITRQWGVRLARRLRLA